MKYEIKSQIGTISRHHSLRLAMKKYYDTAEKKTKDWEIVNIETGETVTEDYEGYNEVLIDLGIIK